MENVSTLLPAMPQAAAVVVNGKQPSAGSTKPNSGGFADVLATGISDTSPAAKSKETNEPATAAGQLWQQFIGLVPILSAGIPVLHPAGSTDAAGTAMASAAATQVKEPVMPAFTTTTPASVAGPTEGKKATVAGVTPLGVKTAKQAMTADIATAGSQMVSPQSAAAGTEKPFIDNPQLQPQAPVSQTQSAVQPVTVQSPSLSLPNLAVEIQSMPAAAPVLTAARPTLPSLQAGGKISSTGKPALAAATDSKHAATPEATTTEAAAVPTPDVAAVAAIDKPQENAKPVTTKDALTLPDQDVKSADQSANPPEQPVNSVIMPEPGTPVHQQTAGVAASEKASPASGDQYQVVNQIVEHAKLIQRPANTEMVIKLKPEHLGELTLRVTTGTDGAVSATFHTSNMEVRSTIESTLPQLRQEMAGLGFKLDYVGVYTGLEHSFSDQRQNNWQQPPQNARHADASVEDTDFVQAVQALSTTGATDAAAGIDYRV